MGHASFKRTSDVPQVVDEFGCFLLAQAALFFSSRGQGEISAIQHLRTSGNTLGVEEKGRWCRQTPNPRERRQIACRRMLLRSFSRVFKVAEFAWPLHEMNVVFASDDCLRETHAFTGPVSYNGNA